MPGLFFYNYQHCNHSSLLRGKTYEGIKNGDLDLFASIHFPLAREDPRDVPFIVQPTEASIHSPLAREDEKHLISPRDFERFNPLPSCEGRLLQHPAPELHIHASIHFPLARED